METRTRRLNQENGFGFPCALSVSSNMVQHGGKLLGKKIEGGGGMKPRKPLQELSCKKKNSENLIAEKAKPEKAKNIIIKGGGGRKRAPLGDLTNCTKLLFQTQKNSLKPNPAEEGCLHDHQQCIKAQKCTLDLDSFLETVGIRKDCSTPVLKAKLPPLSTTSKVQSPWTTRLEFDQTPPTSSRLESPMMHRYKDVEALEFGIDCTFLDFSGFKLKESPSK